MKGGLNKAPRPFSFHYGSFPAAVRAPLRHRRDLWLTRIYCFSPFGGFPPTFSRILAGLLRFRNALFLVPETKNSQKFMARFNKHSVTLSSYFVASYRKIAYFSIKNISVSIGKFANNRIFVRCWPSGEQLPGRHPQRLCVTFITAVIFDKVALAGCRFAGTAVVTHAIELNNPKCGKCI